MINSSIYGGGLYGPSFRGRDRMSTSRPLLGREGGRPRPQPVASPTKPKPKPARPGTPDPMPVNQPTTTPKPKPKVVPKKKLSDLEASLNKVWQIPKLTTPTLLTPTLQTPTLTQATLKDFNVTPIEIGDLPTLEAAPDQAPVVAMPDRQSAEQRRVRLAELSRIKGMKGYGSTLLSGGGRGDTRSVQTRRGV